MGSSNHRLLHTHDFTRGQRPSANIHEPRPTRLREAPSARVPKPHGDEVVSPNIRLSRCNDGHPIDNSRGSRPNRRAMAVPDARLQPGVAARYEQRPVRLRHSPLRWQGRLRRMQRERVVSSSYLFRTVLILREIELQLLSHCSRSSRAVLRYLNPAASLELPGESHGKTKTV
jgi:hypothetical protein